MLLYERDDLTAPRRRRPPAGLQVMIEGVGDRGIDFALDAIEAALAAQPAADHRMRVEHCCYVTPPILERLKRLGVVDSLGHRLHVRTRRRLRRQSRRSGDAPHVAASQR